ncbi:MAG TPA: hypothetical protein VFF27_15955 [Bacteroidia bacterium]|jgi:hypothetical protein|nr:hypothetical protein [Bacteroidia bacterium]
MKKEKSLFPNEFASEPIHGQDGEYFNYSRIEIDGAYAQEFEEEYESYDSDYDLNIK